MVSPDDFRVRVSSGNHAVAQECDRDTRTAAANAALPIARTEGSLGQDETKQLPLKNGRLIDVRLGLATYRSLVRLFEKDAGLFNALRAMADGHDEAVSVRQRRALRHALYLQPDLTIREAVRDVLLSAYQESPEGPVLANPFKLDSPEQVRELEQMDQARLDRLIRRLWHDDDQRFRQ